MVLSTTLGKCCLRLARFFQFRYRLKISVSVLTLEINLLKADSFFFYEGDDGIKFFNLLKLLDILKNIHQIF